MKKITIQQPAKPALLGLNDLKAGDFYVGIPNAEGEECDLMFVAGHSVYAATRFTMDDRLSGSICRTSDLHLIRIRDGYVCLSIASDYRGFLPADVEITARRA